LSFDFLGDIGNGGGFLELGRFFGIGDLEFSRGPRAGKVVYFLYLNFY
jgi:hypothetical protein